MIILACFAIVKKNGAYSWLLKALIKISQFNLGQNSGYLKIFKLKCTFS